MRWQSRRRAFNNVGIINGALARDKPSFLLRAGGPFFGLDKGALDEAVCSGKCYSGGSLAVTLVE
jgi:hypothetical protein